MGRFKNHLGNNSGDRGAAAASSSASGGGGSDPTNGHHDQQQHHPSRRGGGSSSKHSTNGSKQASSASTTLSHPLDGPADFRPARANGSTANGSAPGVRNIQLDNTLSIQVFNHIAINRKATFTSREGVMTDDIDRNGSH